MYNTLGVSCAGGGREGGGGWFECAAHVHACVCARERAHVCVWEGGNVCVHMETGRGRDLGQEQIAGLRFRAPEAEVLGDHHRRALEEACVLHVGSDQGGQKLRHYARGGEGARALRRVHFALHVGQLL